MAAEWDAAAGVYKNARAASSCEVPNPLWIFGYGSLVWRPEERWSDYDARPCAVRGWRRYFAQLSTDHRGVPGAPGLVCTLLEDAPEATTRGVAYRVPDADADAVLDDLDFREKGGYTRKIARCDDGRRRAPYSATRDNPNFVEGLDSDDAAAVDKAARIIATAVGPSGDNAAYLLNLADALEGTDRIWPRSRRGSAGAVAVARGAADERRAPRAAARGRLRATPRDGARRWRRAVAAPSPSAPLAPRRRGDGVRGEPGRVRGGAGGRDPAAAAVPGDDARRPGRRQELREAPAERPASRIPRRRARRGAPPRRAAPPATGATPGPPRRRGSCAARTRAPIR
ncbi:hypothetical protein JL720_14775 [Aureococcus anophagefferens]|nr:hypothetical protein JL720_14775 [Aureococcus anophagefferens]